MVNFIDCSDDFQRTSTKRTERPEERLPASRKKKRGTSGIADSIFKTFGSPTVELPPPLGHVSLLENQTEPPTIYEQFSCRINGTLFIIEKKFKGSEDLKQDKIYFKDSKQLYYEGETDYGVPHGQGTMTANNKRYTGEFSNGLFISGVSSEFLENGDRYDEKVENGEPSGEGTYTFTDGATYRGQFLAGKFHGYGVFTTPEGDRYSGNHKDGLKHGKGVYHYSNGDRYEGEFRKGKRNGQGAYTFADGRKYVVNFRNGKPDGFGIYYAPDAKIYHQVWQKGKLISEGEIQSL